MPRRLPAALAAIAAVALLAGCGGSAAGSDALTRVPVADRKTAPTLAGQTLEGTAYDVQGANRGKVVVLNFWGSWCPPCRAEAGDLQAASAQLADAGVAFVGVNIKDQRGAAQAFVRAQGVNYPSLFDPAGQVGLRLRDTLPPAAIPTTVVLDRQGRPAARWLGGITAQEIVPVVREIAAEPA